MKRPLRLLHLEDDPDYSDLVRIMLTKEGYEVEVVLAEGRAAFEKALAPERFDLILADYLLPSYNGLAALRAAQKKCPETPFLLVSGTIGEYAAIESLKAGATDYVLKNWPEHLVPAVRRAIQEAEERRQRRRAEAELVRRERHFRAITENSLDILTVLDQEGHFIHNSPSIKRVLGYEPRALIGKSAFALIHPEDLPRVLQAFEAILKTRERPFQAEYRFRHQDGSWRFLEGVGQNRLQDSAIAGVVVNARDITDRKQAEEALRRSEERYRLIFDSNPKPTMVYDHLTLAILEANKAAVQHYGYSAEEFKKLTLRDIRPPEDVPAMIEYMHRIAKAEPNNQVRYAGIWRHRRKNGEIMDVEIKWCPIAFGDRMVSLAMITDITERKRVELRNAAFAKLGQNLSSASSPAEAARIIRSAADDLFRWDAFTLDLYSAEEGRIYPLLNVDTNARGQRFDDPGTGQPKELSGMARRVVTKGAELILREEPFVIPEDVSPIGDPARPSASLMLVPIRNRTQVIGLLSIQSYTPKAYQPADLATLQALADHCGGALERIRAEQALRDSEQRFRELFEGSPDAVFVEDVHGGVLDVNPAACRLHGMTREDLMGRNISELVPPGEQATTTQKFQALVDGRLAQIEGASYTRDGRIVPVEIRASRITYANQPAVLLHVRDIADRKRAEAALRSSEMLFHSVWENSADGMRLTDEHGNIVAVNEAFCKLVGLRREELEGKPLTVTEAGPEPPEQRLMEYCQRFREGATEKQKERQLTLRNGQEVILEEINSRVELRGRPPLQLGIFRDVMAQKRLEEQLRQSQKMEAIGQLAGGVAHDFNNILTVIHGHASLLMANGGLAPVHARSAQQIGQAAERAASLTRQLLAFSRRQVMQPRQLDMNEVVSNMTKMLGRILGEDITLQLNYWPQPALVQADNGMMEQVLLNLAVNARDAMPKGGLLAIKVAELEVEAPPGRVLPEARAGWFVCLSITDNGCGIPSENLWRIFDPFFTTKSVGKGTGLGLATVYGIVNQHRGWVEVESELKRGTVFRVFLPRSTQPAKAPDEPSAPAIVRGGQETILVVEDETPVRELVCDLLRRHGYHVLPAESSAQALQVWQGSKDRIDLVLTDLVMPDQMNGRELVEKLWVERPRLKVLFTSGYSQEVVGKDFVLRRGLNYLQKPYPPHKLARAVRDCLDAVN